MDTSHLDRQIRRQDRSCTGKRGSYPNRARAKQAARYVLKMFGYKTRLYRCRFCDNWHLTTVRES